MRIGILTFHFSDNYGAALQAYALRRWFIERGHFAEFIDYRPEHIESGGGLTFPSSMNKLRSDLKVLYLYLTAYISRSIVSQSRMKRCALFREEYLGVNDGGNIVSADQLAYATEKYDMIVVGSDQIWSPSAHYGFDSNYFLSFAQDFNGRKISYAASFGRDILSQHEEAQLPSLLNGFDAISVRELSGVAHVERATGHCPKLVPDPTLLHGDYSELYESPIADGLIKDGYIFCYALRSPDNIRQTAGLVSRKLGFPVVSPYNPHRRWIEIGKTIYPDPAEWISALKASQFVVTNSFHGTAFALLFKKPFIVAGLTGTRSAANARAMNLLKLVGQEERFTSDFSSENVESLLSKSINWECVEEKLCLMRGSGESFLLDQIEGRLYE